MSTSRVSRFVVAAAAVGFAGVAGAVWIAPEYVAGHLGVAAVRGLGTATLRADVGGLFAGLAMLCGAAAWTRGRSWIVAAAAMLGAIAAGRVLGWIGAGRIGADALALAIELSIGAALVAMARAADMPGAPVGADAVVPRRRGWRPLRVAGALAVVPFAGVSLLMTPAVEQRIFEAGAKQLTATVNTAPLEDDALRVGVCGSSAPLPSAARAKACVAVFAGGRYYVVDTGPESVENLVLWGIPLAKIGGVLLTHFHSDHIGDLGELQLQTWAGGRPAPLDVYGGPGVERVVAGFNDAYRMDQGYRTEHHTEKVMPSATWGMVAHPIVLDGAATAAKDRSAVVLERDGLRITAFEVDHAPIAPAYAYRFDYKGRSALITGDLKHHPPLVRAATGVDVMVSEAISVSMTRALGRGATAAGRAGTAAVMHDIEDYHIGPEEAARIANDAKARLLVFYHLLPAPDGVLPRRVFARGVDEARDGDWTIADDGSLYTLPLGSTDVRMGRVVE